MNYYDAARIRKKGFAKLMTERLTSGQGIVSSVRGSLSDRSMAKSMAMKERFDPMNIAKFLTGGSNLAPAIVGRLMGRSKQDIRYFTGKKQYENRGRPNYYGKYNSGMGGGRSGKATEVLEKIVSFMQDSREKDLEEQDTFDSYNEMNEYMKEDNHKEVMNVFRDAIQKQRKAMKDMAKEAKKRQAQEGTGVPTAPAPRPSPTAPTRPAPAPAPAPVPAPRPAPAPTPAPAPRPAPAPAKEAADKAAKDATEKITKDRLAKEAAEKITKDRLAKEAAEKATKDRLAKEAADAKRIKDAADAKKAADTAKKQKPAPAAPTATPAPPVVAPKPPIVKPAITEAAKTAAKVGTGVAVAAAMNSAIGGAESGGNYDISYGDSFDKKTGKMVNRAKDPKTNQPLNLKTP